MHDVVEIHFFWFPKYYEQILCQSYEFGLFVNNKMLLLLHQNFLGFNIEVLLAKYLHDCTLLFFIGWKHWKFSPVPQTVSSDSLFFILVCFHCWHWKNLCMYSRDGHNQMKICCVKYFLKYAAEKWNFVALIHKGL